MSFPGMLQVLVLSAGGFSFAKHLMDQILVWESSSSYVDEIWVLFD
jgi:hypothetical protein